MTEGQSSRSGRRAATCALAFAVWSFLAAGPACGESLTITTFAGPPEAGSGAIDGTGSAARFYNPYGVAVDGSGNLYIADTGNNTIRRITPGGVVSTLGGLALSSGSANGTGGAARFYFPRDVAVDGSGNVYVADGSNHTIRKITPAGVISTLAGLAGNSGSADGAGSAARFYSPFGVAVDGSGNVYVGDRSNHTIRKVTPGGVVNTLAGLAGTHGSADGTGSAARFYYPSGVATDGSGNVYVADSTNHIIRKITAGGVVSTWAGLAGSSGSANGTGSAARFNGPYGVTVDGSGNVYVADTGNHTIRKITPGAVVSTLAGSAGNAGSANGTGNAARFNGPYGVAVDGSGNVYAADVGNNTIRKITPATVVSTLAGFAVGSGSADGTGSAARFNNPKGVAVGGSGNVYVADTSNHTIRRITQGGVVSTLAGLAGSSGSADGTGSAARFYQPNSVAVDGSGNVYVADTWNCTIRKLTTAGVVSTLAGTAGSPGSADGTGSAARFSYPCGVAVDGSGNVYVADIFNYTIRKITAGGVVSTLAGLAGSQGSADGTGSAARFNNPSGVAVDGSGNVYVADANNYTIRKITPAGAVSTLAGLAGSSGSADGTGSAARFWVPESVAVDGSGNVYVADNGNQTVRKITPAGVVSTLAGLAGSSGSADGIGSSARFDLPYGVAVDGSGSVYVADTSNNTIRKGVPSVADAATIDQANGAAGATRQLDTNPQTASAWQWSQIRVPTGSSAALSSTTVRNPTFTPDVADIYVFRLLATDASGKQSISTVQLNVPGPAATFAVSGFPNPATAGTAGSFTVTALDASGSIALGYTGTVHFSSSDSAAALPGDYTFASGDNGTHSFSATLKTAGTRSITAADTSTGSINGTQSGITVSPAGAAKLGFTAQPSGGRYGAVFGAQPVVAVQDGYGNTVTSNGNWITLAIGTNPGSGTLSATTNPLAASSGMASFAGVKIDKPGNGYTLTASTPGLTSATSSAFNITPGPAVTLAVTGYPSPVTAGTTGNVTVTAQDAGGYTATGYTGTAHFTSTDGQAVLPADYTFLSGDNGTRIFSVELKTAGTQSITATDTATGTITGTQVAIIVAPQAATTFALTGPSSVTAGVPFNLTVTAQDQYGNTATSYTGIVHFTSSDPLAVLPGDYTFQAGDNGAHTFSMTLTAAGTCSISVEEAGTNPINPPTIIITVNPAPASTLAVAGFPSPTTAGSAGNVTVTAQDAGGNTASNYTGTIHFTGSDAQGELPADYTFVSGDNGSHSFSVVLRTAGTQSITATDTATGTITGTQSGISVAPGTLARFALALSSQQMNGVAFTGANTLTAQDAFGNTVATFDASVDNLRITANAPLVGDVFGLGTGNNNVLNRATDFVAGVADLTALGMRFVGNYATGTFTATSATGKSGTSGSVTINGPGPGQPGKDMQAVMWLTIPASVSIAWGAGTTGKAAGDVAPLDWTVQDATGGQLGRSGTYVSNDANNNLAMNLENTSNTGTKARAFAAVTNSGGWNIGSTPATDTFAIKAQLGANPQTALAAAAQELTGTATLAKGADQPLVLTVMTPTGITRDAGVQKTIFVVLTATPE